MRNEEFEKIISTNSRLGELQQSTILITGVTGTIGSYLFEFLEYYTHKECAGIQFICPIRNKAKLRHEWLIYNNVEWSDYEHIDGINVDVNYIIHCASPTRSCEFVKKPVETIDAIVSGTQRLLNFFKTHGQNGFLYLSSIEIYGNNQNRQKRFLESDAGNVDVLKIRSCYPEAKRLTENLCMAYAHEFRLPIKIVRLSQIIGLNEYDDRLIAYLCKSAIEKNQIVLRSDGKATRSYCYIMDCISAMLYVLIDGDSTAYNIGNPDMVASVYELAKYVSDKFIGSPVIVECKKDAKYPPSGNLVLDTSKIMSLGWMPYVDMSDAFHRLIERKIGKQRE